MHARAGRYTKQEIIARLIEPSEGLSAQGDTVTALSSRRRAATRLANYGTTALISTCPATPRDVRPGAGAPLARTPAKYATRLCG